MWRSSRSSHGRKARSSITKSPYRTTGSHPAYELNTTAISTSLALHAISTDFFDESQCSPDLSSNEKPKRDLPPSTSSSAAAVAAATAHALDHTRGPATMDKNDKNAHLNKRDFDSHFGRDLGLNTESGTNVVDGILRIRGTYYAKEYVTVTAKLNTLLSLQIDQLCGGLTCILAVY